MAVHYSVDASIAVIPIDRPEVANAIDRPTAEALAAFRRFDADPSLAIAVLTGANGKFCAGADLKAMSEAPARASSPRVPRPHSAATAWAPTSNGACRSTRRSAPSIGTGSRPSERASSRTASNAMHPAAGGRASSPEAGRCPERGRYP
jgi:Enoyl-CoA hydratase/isomerase